MRRSSRSLVSAVALGSALLLAGCAGGSTASTAGGAASAGASSPAAGSSSAAAATGLAAKTPAEIYAAAKAAASGASSVHIKGKAGAVAIDLHIAGENTAGNVTLPGGSVTLLRVGPKIWIKASSAFWAKSGIKATAAAKLNNRYVDISTQSAQFAGFTSIKTFFSGTDDVVKATKGAVGPVNGVQTIALTDPKDGSLLYIATEGDAFPIRVSNTGADGSQLDFTDWNVPLDVKAPAATEIIDLVKALSS